MNPTDPMYSAPTRIVSPNRPDYVGQGAQDPFHSGTQVRVSGWRSLSKGLFGSLKFLAETEVHVYAFAVAVNILISFYPFIVAMTLICRHILHWKEAVDVIIETVANFFPGDFGFNAAAYLRPASMHKLSLLSLFLLFFTANGIFTPLEVALNRIWRAKANRNFLLNQVISLALIFICGALVLFSVCVTTLNNQFLGSAFGTSQFVGVLQSLLLHLVALPVTMLMIFLIYWLLPNAKIPVGSLLPSAIVVSILLQISAFVNYLTWPWLHEKLKADVPPFVQSISIIFWAFIATLIVLAGAEWSARVKVDIDHRDAHSAVPVLH